MLNKKFEHFLSDDFATMKNHRNKERRRYCVSTSAAIYLCKPIKIFRPLKAVRIFSWTDLQSLDISDSKKTIFVFKDEIVEVSFDNPLNFITPVLSALHQLFGGVFPFKTELGNNCFDFQLNQVCMVAYLYVAYCKSDDVIPNEILFNNLIAIQQFPQITIDFSQLMVDQKSIQPMINSLKYVTNISYLLIPGKFIKNTFVYLREILCNNEGLTHLLVDGYDTHEGFEQFADTIGASSIKTLCLRSITLPLQVLIYLFQIIPNSDLMELKFYHCQMEPNVIKYMANNPTMFTRLSLIAFNESDLFNNISVLKELFDFLLSAKISAVELIDDHIDIAEVFSILDRLSLIPLIGINLSKNECLHFSGQYNLPVTLTELTLMNVKWSVKSLLALMTTQRFKNQITIDLSGLQGNISDLHTSFKSPSTNNFKAIIWDNNLISTNFFVFLSRYSDLRKLSLNECTYAPELSSEISNSMVLYLQRSKLRELSIRGSIGNPHAKLVNSIFAVLKSHQTLELLDITDNNVGDTGVKNLIRALEGNTMISQIAFDGSNVTNPQTYIQVFEKLSHMDQITAVALPRKDIEILIKNGADKKKLEHAWQTLQVSISDHQKLKFEQNIETFPSKQIATWNISIQLPPADTINHWVDLRSKFSLANITGIRRLNLENDQSNLIILDGD